MAEIIWTPFALEDLQTIYDYIAQDSPTYASRYVDKLVDRFDILIDHPKSGKIVPNLKTSRYANLSKVAIVSSINSPNEIAIIRIHHSARLLK